MSHHDGRGFTLESYASLLNETGRLYPFAGFEILADPKLAERRFCLIRHDIDMSPERALDVAKIEAEKGVRATYMVLLTGSFYSLFEKATRDVIAEIAGLGHDIGLHFDAAWHNIMEKAALNEAVAWEAAVLRRLLGGIPVRNFSFHNTNEFTMTCKADAYAGLWNAYAGSLQDEVSYVSDSNGYWRFRSWEEALEQQPSRLQVLTHPEWWTTQPAEPAEKTCRLLAQRSSRTWFDHSGQLARAGRDNRSTLPAALKALQHDDVAGSGELVMRWLSGHREAAFLDMVRRINRSGAGREDGDPALTDLAQRLLHGESAEDRLLEELFAQGILLLADTGDAQTQNG